MRRLILETTRNQTGANEHREISDRQLLHEARQDIARLLTENVKLRRVVDRACVGELSPSEAVSEWRELAETLPEEWSGHIYDLANALEALAGEG